MKFNSKDTNVFFTSDTHYGHRNIVSGVSLWPDKDRCRNFDTVEKMNDIIVKGINDNVGQDDVLFHLGDWSMGGFNNIWKFRERLNVRTIHLIVGNHDEHISRDKMFPYPEINHEQFPGVITHHEEGVLTFPVGAKDMFTTIENYREISIDGQAMVMSHFPMASWNNMGKGSWMLHGHTHANLFINSKPDHWYNTGRILDMGLDSKFKLFNEYTPFSFRELRSIMNKRNNLINDYERS